MTNLVAGHTDSACQDVFHCRRWPGCECPDGTVRHDCPGITAAGRKGDRPSATFGRPSAASGEAATSEGQDNGR